MELSNKSNIDPKIWGNNFWDTLHFTTFGYPDLPNSKDKLTYKEFILNFVKILPCDKCTTDARKYIGNITQSEWDDILKNKEEFTKWSWKFHDVINVKLNKKSVKLDYFLKNFISDKKPYKMKFMKKVKWSAIILFIIAILLFYAKYLRRS